MYLDEAVGCGVTVHAYGGVLTDGGATVTVAAVMLPICNPINEHLAYLHISNGHFFHGVHAERRSVKHLLYGA